MIFAAKALRDDPMIEIGLFIFFSLGDLLFSRFCQCLAKGKNPMPMMRLVVILQCDSSSRDTRLDEILGDEVLQVIANKQPQHLLVLRIFQPQFNSLPYFLFFDRAHRRFRA